MKTYTYFAFISYAHKDEKYAAWLQQRLESYRIPVKIRKTQGDGTPKHLRPVFRDKTDLRPGNLEKTLASELDDSKYLIVICSPAAQASLWVKREIEHFRQSDNADNIIPVIVDCPSSTMLTDCYPEALDKSTLGISVAEFGKTKTVLHILSRILDIRFDSLYERHKKTRNRNSLLLGVLSLFILFMLSIPTKELFEITQLQQALTNTVSVVSHIVSSLESSDSPTIRERTASLESTWKAESNSENNLIFPLERRRTNSKIYTNDIRKELANSFETKEMIPVGKEAFREQLNLLNNLSNTQPQAIVNSVETIARKKQNALNELNAIDEARSTEDAQRHLGYFQSELHIMRLNGMNLFWQLHHLLKPLADQGHPEAKQALSLATSIPFDKQSVLDKLRGALNQKSILIDSTKKSLQAKKQQLSAAYNRIRAKCRPTPNDPPELVWGKMIRLLTGSSRPKIS